MGQSNPEDTQKRLEEQKKRALEQHEESSESVKVQKNQHEGQESTIGIDQALADLKEKEDYGGWPGADNYAITGGPTTEKTDEPEKPEVISYEQDEFELGENCRELMGSLESIEDEGSNYSEVNQIFNEFRKDGRKDKISQYMEDQENEDIFGFKGFTSGLGKIVEEGLLELANEMPEKGGSYRFGEDNGVLKTANGYTRGAVPDHPLEEDDDEDQVYDSLDELAEPELEALGQTVNSVTESYSRTENEGKYLEAFQMYTEDVSQSEIADEVGIDSSTLSIRAKEWREKGLMEKTEEGTEYTEAGKAMDRMIDKVYSTR